MSYKQYQSLIESVKHVISGGVLNVPFENLPKLLIHDRQVASNTPLLESSSDNKITDDDTTPLVQYTHSSAALNSDLYHNSTAPKEERVTNFSINPDHLDKIIHSHRLQHDLVTYSGLRRDPSELQTHGWNSAEGTFDVHLPAYTSSSLSKSIAHRFATPVKDYDEDGKEKHHVLRINNPAGSRGISLDSNDVTYKYPEQEYLIPRNSVFRIKNTPTIEEHNGKQYHVWDATRLPLHDTEIQRVANTKLEPFHQEIENVDGHRFFKTTAAGEYSRIYGGDKRQFNKDIAEHGKVIHLHTKDGAKLRLNTKSGLLGDSPIHDVFKKYPELLKSNILKDEAKSFTETPDDIANSKGNSDKKIEMLKSGKFEKSHIVKLLSDSDFNVKNEAAKHGHMFDSNDFEQHSNNPDFVQHILEKHTGKLSDTVLDNMAHHGVINPHNGLSDTLFKKHTENGNINRDEFFGNAKLTDSQFNEAMKASEHLIGKPRILLSASMNFKNVRFNPNLTNSQTLQVMKTHGSSSSASKMLASGVVPTFTANEKSYVDLEDIAHRKFSPEELNHIEKNFNLYAKNGYDVLAANTPHYTRMRVNALHHDAMNSRDNLERVYIQGKEAIPELRMDHSVLALVGSGHLDDDTHKKMSDLVTHAIQLDHTHKTHIHSSMLMQPNLSKDAADHIMKNVKTYADRNSGANSAVENMQKLYDARFGKK